MTFHEKLDRLMEERGLNKHTLSIDSGIPYTTIDGLYKKGYENARLSTLTRLAAFFSTSLDYLVDDGAADHDAGRFWRLRLSGTEGRLILKRRALDAHGKRMLDLVAAEEAARMAADTARAIAEATTARPRAKAALPTVDIDIYEEAAAAGFANPADGQHETRTFFADVVPTGTDFGVCIAGDSMGQAVPDGCIAWVKVVHEVFNNQIAIFGLQDGFVCKRAKTDRYGRIIALESDNPIYADVRGADLQGLRIIGEVIGIFCEDAAG